MSTVTSASALTKRFTTLGWSSSQNDLLQAALQSGIPASVIVLYLDALIANDTTTNDQTIAGVTAAQGTSITAFLKAKGLVGT